MKRAVSLISSTTEMLYKLGFGESLVGRSHECDYPDQVLKLPICTSPSFDVTGSSVEIDDQVRALLKSNKPVYFVYDELLKQLEPEIIFTQTQCEVCSVSLKDVHRAVCSWSDFNAELVSMKAVNLEGIFEDIKAVAHAMGDLKRGDELVGFMKDEMAKWSEKACKIRYRPRVVFVEWIDPMMVAANWMPELSKLADVEHCFGQTGVNSYRMDWETVVAEDPDVLIFIPCGWTIPRIKKEMELLIKKESWSKLKAVKNHQVYVSDGNQFFNRPGPRIFESFQIMLEIFYGEHFNFGYQNKYWERVKVGVNV